MQHGFASQLTESNNNNKKKLKKNPPLQNSPPTTSSFSSLDIQDPLQTTSQYLIWQVETTVDEETLPGKLPETPLRIEPPSSYKVGSCCCFSFGFFFLLFFFFPFFSSPLSPQKWEDDLVTFLGRQMQRHFADKAECYSSREQTNRLPLCFQYCLQKHVQIQGYFLPGWLQKESNKSTVRIQMEGFLCVEAKQNII